MYGTGTGGAGGGFPPNMPPPPTSKFFFVLFNMIRLFVKELLTNLSNQTQYI